MESDQGPGGGLDHAVGRAALLAQVRDTQSLVETARATMTELSSTLDAAVHQLAEAARSLSCPPQDLDTEARTPWLHASDDLTNAEEEVASLAAQGLTNAEISDRLFVSQNTVKSHLARVFAKVGVSSRRELTQRAAQQALNRGP